MNWRRVLRDHREPDERSRKGAELMELHAESSLAVRKLEHADAERRRVADSVRNTVAALRAGGAG